MLTVTANRVTPLRSPDRSWEERQLTQIIVGGAEMAAGRVGSHTICRYLIDAMDWFIQARGNAGGAEPDPQQPADPFEEWLIERWLRDIRSDEFRDSVQHERLMAEWERGR